MNRTDAGAAVVHVEGFAEGRRCDFCRKANKEGVVCTFVGGNFRGFVCKADFWKLLRLAEIQAGRLELHEEEHDTPLFPELAGPERSPNGSAVLG